jgi:hypothetical protein
MGAVASRSPRRDGQSDVESKWGLSRRNVLSGDGLTLRCAQGEIYLASWDSTDSGKCGICWSFFVILSKHTGKAVNEQSNVAERGREGPVRYEYAHSPSLPMNQI